MKVKFTDTTKHNTKYKGLRPFTHGRRVWKDDAATEKIKYENAVGGVLFDEKLLVLEGNELPELFVIWKIAFMNRIYNHSSLSWDSKITVLTRICRNEALAVVNNTLSKCRDGATVHFEKISIKARVDALDTDSPDDSDDDAEFQAYAVSEQYKEDIINEILYHLSLKIFGSDHAGKSAYIQLRRTIHQFKVDLNFGIRKWAERLEDFQSYLPHCPWNAGERRGQLPKPFTEFEMREILEHNLVFEQLMELYNMDWSVQDQPYKETITKLEGLEATIIREKLMQKRVAALEGGDSSGRVNNKKRKAYNGDSNNDSSQSSNANSGQCPHCKKRHKGVCRFKPSATDEAFSTSKSSKFNKPQRQYINQLIEAAVKKTRGESHVVESDEDDENNWSKNMTQGEHMFVLSAAQHDQGTDSPDIDIDEDDLRQFRKNYKAVQKKLKKSRK